MGRQFRFYLLPIDIDQLLGKLQAKYGLRMLSATSDKPEPSELSSTINDNSSIAKTGMYHFGQIYLVSGIEARTPMWFGEKLNKWHIDSGQAEVIELSTCDYGIGILNQGRFYYQKDMLSPSKDSILPKSDDFVTWAETIFRMAKKELEYSRKLDAYIGQAANDWRRHGGRFITGFHGITKEPIYAETYD